MLKREKVYKCFVQDCKKQKYYSLPDHQLAENLILVLICKKGQKVHKKDFVTKSVGIIVTIIFMCKNMSQIAGKSFATKCFFTDHWNHKTVNKTTCRTLLADLRQL